MHLGSAQFAVTGPVKYTMTARHAIELCKSIQPRVVIPVHYEGWSHFREGRGAIEREWAHAPPAVREALHILPIGEPVDIYDAE
jgi:L-ascorbate metabolism protein UlaG (beta-lactamase superfamily)